MDSNSSVEELHYLCSASRMKNVKLIQLVIKVCACNRKICQVT